MSGKLTASIIAGALLLSSCSIKEDRSACPCILVVDFSSIHTKSPEQSSRLWLYLRNKDGKIYRNTLDTDIYDWPEWFSVKVPRNTVSSFACQGARNFSISPDGCSLRLESGLQADSIYLHCRQIDCSGDKAYDRVDLHKKWCTVEIEMAERDASTLPQVTIKGRWNGYDTATLLPTEGPFACTSAADGDGIFRIRIPRQADGSLTLLMPLLPDTDPESFPLGRMILDAGYDWDKEDLDDIRLTVDRIRQETHLDIEPWKKTECEIILRTGAGNSLSSSGSSIEDSIEKACVWFFRPGTLGDQDILLRREFTGAEAVIGIGAGTYDIVVTANVTAETDVAAGRYAFSGIRTGTLPMSKVFRNMDILRDGRIDVNLERMVTKVRTGTVANRLSGGVFAGKQLTVKNIYPINIFRWLPYTGYGYSLWGNGITADDYICRSGRDQAVTDDIRPVPIPFAQEAEIGITMYLPPNPESSDCFSLPEESTEYPMWSPRATKLVVECEIEGQTCYYPITLPRDGINRSIDISRIEIYSFGSSCPDMPVSPESIRVISNVNGWNTLMINENI